MQACSFLSFLGILLLNPDFSSTILSHKFVQVFDTLKFQSIAWNSEKGNLPDPFIHPFSFVMPFIWIWTCKLMTSLINSDYQLIVRSFLPAITFMWSDQQIPGWPQFFQQQVFPSVPFLVDFSCSIIVRSFHLNFLCAKLLLIWSIWVCAN